MTAGTAASGARVAWFYCAETDGAISATAPAFSPIRFTGNGLTEQANELTSDELRADRHRVSSRKGAVSVTGDITGEMSYGTYDDLIEAVFSGTFTTDVLKTGTTRRSFAILKRNLDIGIDTLYRGCEVNELKLSCPLTEKIAVTFSVIGKSGESYTVPSGATFDAATTTDYMTTYDGSLSVAGSAFNAATDLNVTISNNKALKYSLFNADAYAVKDGMIDVTGDLSAYIEDDSLKGKWRAETDTAFSIVLTDAATGGNTYTIAIPKARFTAVSADNYSGDDLGIQQLQFRALLDSGSATEISLTRAAAA